jgi:hypothetical protein
MKGLLLALLAVPMAFQAAELVPVGRVEVRGGYLSAPGGANAGFGTGSLLFLPAVKTGMGIALPTLFANYTAQERSVEEDAYFVQRGLLAFLPAFQMKLGESFDGKVRASARHAWAKETLDEKLGQGLYDNEQYGAGFELGALLTAGRFSLGVDGYRQGYPNYRELGSRETDGKNVATKDHQAVKVSLQGKGKEKEGIPYEAGFSLLSKDYTDCYVVKKDGTLDSSTKRQDMMAQGKLGFEVPLQAWRPGFDMEGALLNSNQAAFDPAYNKYQKGFYDVISFEAGPSLGWWDNGSPSGSGAKLAYKWGTRSYSGRLIRTESGAYALGMQEDMEHRLSVDGRWAFAKHFALLGGASGLWARSNQGYERTLRANYEIYAANLGLEAKL